MGSSRTKRAVWILSALIFLLATAGAAHPPRRSDGPGGRRHRVFFPDTDQELNVYDITGREDGPTLLIIGGIHGNEPGGYLAADLYADLTLRRGNLIVVPRANIYSIRQNERGARGDLNRMFGSATEEHQVDTAIIGVLTDLMKEADVLLNLHDGSGFYAPEWESDLVNPLRWGQTVIIDTDSLRLPDGSVADLEAMARAATEKANEGVAEEKHRFRVLNTHTYDADSPHAEQRGSATFHAVSHVGIPAFGIETSKEIGDEDRRVEYQVLVINSFMGALGIVPDHPRFALEPPELGYVTVSIDGAPPVVVENGGSLAVPPGARISIMHVEANYERGLVVDVEGLGGMNDRRVPLRLDRDTRVMVWKDKYPCGEVFLRVDPSAVIAPGLRTGAVAPPEEVRIEAFRVAVNGRWTFLPPGESLRVFRGDELQLADPLGPGDPRSYDLNLRGFVGNPVENDGEDRGYPVHTDHDMLQRFSLSPEEERYEVRAERGTTILASAVVDIVEPRFQYVLLHLDGGPRLALAHGDTLRTAGARSLRLDDIVTDPRDVAAFTVNFRGYANPAGAEDRGQTVDLRSGLLQRFSLEGSGRYYEITVSLGSTVLGRVVVDLGTPPPSPQ